MTKQCGWRQMNTKTLPRNFKGESFIKVIKLFDLLLNCHPFKTERITDHQRSTVYCGTLRTVHNCSKIKSLHSIFLPVCCSASDTTKHDSRIHTAKKRKRWRNRRERQLQIITHIQKLQQSRSEKLLVPWCSILQRGHHNNLDNSRCAEEVDDLVVGEGDGGHLADLHQSTPFAQPHLPGKAVGLHVGHNALWLDMEAQLTQTIAFQHHLHRLQEPRKTPLTGCHIYRRNTRRHHGLLFICVEFSPLPTVWISDHRPPSQETLLIRPTNFHQRLYSAIIYQTPSLETILTKGCPYQRPHTPKTILTREQASSLTPPSPKWPA